MYWNKPTKKCTHDKGSACMICNPQLFNPSVEESKLRASIEIGVKLLECKRKYYSGGTSPLSDKEYDSLEGSLKSIDPDNPVLSFVGYDIENDE